MKRLAYLAVLLLSGCSTAPVADFLDWVAPGRVPPGSGVSEGGVCIPQGTLPGANAVVPVPVVPPPGAIPGPAPIPGAIPGPAPIPGAIPGPAPIPGAIPGPGVFPPPQPGPGVIPPPQPGPGVVPPPVPFPVK